MHAIQIRNVSNGTYARLKELAKADRRSLQQETAWLLEQSLAIFGRPGPRDWSQADRILEESKKRYGILPDSTPLIRRMRDDR